MLNFKVKGVSEFWYIDYRDIAHFALKYTGLFMGKVLNLLNLGLIYFFYRNILLFNNFFTAIFTDIIR